MFVKFLFALNGARLSNWTYSTPMPMVPQSSFLFHYLFLTTPAKRSAEIGNFQQHYMSS